MKHKSILASLLAAGAVMLASCGSSDSATDSMIVTGEAEQADVEAAIIEGRTAARALINVPATDTLALQNKLLEARASQSKYVTAGNTRHAEAFDTAFIQTLRAVRPDVARAVEQIK